MFGDGLEQDRLSVLELASRLGNVSEACRQTHMDRASFYAWKRRYQAHGFDGLKDLQPVPCLDPDTLPDTVKERIEVLALAHIANTGARIAAILALSGVQVAPSSVQHVLAERGIGTDRERWLRLELAARQGEALSTDQAAFIEKFNPCFRECHQPSPAPGALLVQDTLFAGASRHGERLYLHVAIDTFSAHAFGFLHPSRQPEAAVCVLHNDVLPFYRAAGCRVDAIETDGGFEFCGDPSHPYRIYLALNEIVHRCPRHRVAHANGFMARFAVAFRDGFVRRPAGRKQELPQTEKRLAVWLERYNGSVPHEGYPNFGQTPRAAFLASLAHAEIAQHGAAF